MKLPEGTYRKAREGEGSFKISSAIIEGTFLSVIKKMPFCLREARPFLSVYRRDGLTRNREMEQGIHVEIS